MNTLLNLGQHLILLLVIPPLILGIIQKTKAWFAGRRGAPLLQPYHDLIKLLRKDLVQSVTATWVFQAGPVIGLVTVVIAGLFVPLAGNSLLAFSGDMLLFAGLLALGRFFLVASALDTGSALEGLGTSREITFSVLIEPTLFCSFLVLAKISGSLSLGTMLGSLPAGAGPSNVLLVLGLFVVLLVEASRIPVDDPDTHLELTMIHEVLVLDHSGPLLALVQYASSVKLLVLGSMLVHVAFPFHLGPGYDALVFTALLLGLGVVIGVLEATMARLRMRRVNSLLVTAFLLCASSLLLMLR